MTSPDVAFWMVNTVQVQTYQSGDSYGPAYSAAASVACWVEDETKMVRDMSGQEVVSSAWLAVAPGDAAKFPVGSKVTLPSGRTAHVITNNALDSGSLDLGLDHAVVTLT